LNSIKNAVRWPPTNIIISIGFLQTGFRV